MSSQTVLEQAIVSYNKAYRKGEPIISDQEYDQLIEQYSKLYPDSNFLKRSVLEKPKESRKQRLPLPMFSLNKLKSIKEVKQWLRSNNIPEDEYLVITPKFDGISLVVDEKNSIAWTRGDGEIGQLSTDHFLQTPIRTDSIHTPYYSFGEAIMSKKNFEKYRGKYANPRNLVAGLFNRDIPGEELKDVDYIRYGSNLNSSKCTQIGELNRINKVECSTLFVRALEFYNLPEETLQKSFTELYHRGGEDYQIDGLVIDINSKELREQLGREENMNPKYARAVKLPEWSSTADTKVRSITWQVSKQGKLKPVINIEPVELSGAMISNVTGYNAKYVLDNNIAKDSIIRITRSGEVIPKHLETLDFEYMECSRLNEEISKCPSCGQSTLWDETRTELVCHNETCKEKQIQKLVHFFTTLEVEEFGEPSIRKLYDYDLNTIRLILTASREELLEIEGYGPKSADRLLNQFKKLEEEGVSLAKLIHAEDVMNGRIGEKTIQLIIDNLDKSRLECLVTVEEKDIKDISKINGVGENTAEVFIKGFLEWNQTEALPIKIRFEKTPKQESIGDLLKENKICFTGVRPSKEMEIKIEKQGGVIVSGVSKNTTHLIVKDLSSTSSKMKKASELGIRILSIQELNNILGL